MTTRSAPPTLKELVEAASKPAPCPLCQREGQRLSDHHLVPRSRGGKVTQAICVDCHRAIHAVFDNKELEKSYSTVEALLEHPELAKMIQFIGTQAGRVRTRRPGR
ncbi:MAG: hypothetical protein U0271_26540 [Polyangiaceae bacterium]